MSGVRLSPAAMYSLPSFPKWLSADGRYLVFTTDAVVVRADTNGGLGWYDAYLYDRTTKAFELISVTKSGVSGNNSSGATSVSDDGRFVAFGSWAKTWSRTIWATPSTASSATVLARRRSA